MRLDLGHILNLSVDIIEETIPSVKGIKACVLPERYQTVHV